MGKNLLILLLILSFTCILSAQQITGSLEGQVLDPEGLPLSAVNIVVSSLSLQGTRGTITDEQGYFRLIALPPGIYSLRITHISYQNQIIEDVIVSLGKTISIGKIKMTTGTLETPDIVISEERSMIDPNSTTLGTNLKSAEFESLPLERNYREITTLLPQANTSFYKDEVNISGGTGWENKYFIDGIDVSDTHEGSIETNIPYNFVKEIQLISGGYEAEYKGSLGGLINVITYSGGNEVHGSVFGFYTADWLSSSPNVGLADPADGPFSNYDVGFGIGGPIVQDKLWYYAAYNPTFSRRNVVLPGLGTTYIDKSVTHSFAAKLTWKPSQQLNLVFTTTGDPTKRTAIGFISEVFGAPPSALLNPDPYLSSRKTGGVNLSLSGTYTIGNNLLLDASISRLNRDEIDEPTTEQGKNEVLFLDTTNVWSGGLSYKSSQRREVTGFKLNTTLFTGDHILKAGVEYDDNALDLDLGYSFLTPGDSSEYLYDVATQLGTVRNRTPSVYFQDSWEITENLRINAGVRWGSQFWVASNGEVTQKIHGPVQPRAGFVFSPGEDGTQKIFGSYGRFEQDVQTGLLGIYLLKNSYDHFFAYDSDPRNGNANVVDTVNLFNGTIAPEIEGLSGQYYDEFSLGYERMVNSKIKIGVKGIYRILREAIDDGYFPLENVQKYGNPGKGPLADFPKVQRDYTALILTIEKHNSERFNFEASYVLSRNYGNYPGLYDLLYSFSFANSSGEFDDVESLKNGTGLLPNDRTHTFKFIGSYRFNESFTAGLSFQWLSGTPLSKLAGASFYKNVYFIEPRGTAGRTPFIWDLNARIVYKLPVSILPDARLIFDIFHILSQRKPVQYVEEQYFDFDENYNVSIPNPNYGKAFRYQKPMSVRMGLEVSF
jgi:Carboxypeptidase regulatory-like domain/TonB dependent receptor-like, beta-barrel